MKNFKLLISFFLFSIIVSSINAQTIGTAITQTGGSNIITDAIKVQGITIGLGGNNEPNSTGIGVSALASNVSGAYNTAVGNSALISNTSGRQNTAFGNGTLYRCIGCNNNCAFGNSALFGTTGNSILANNAFGVQALEIDLGDYNDAFGNAALQLNYTGQGNQAFGYHALCNNRTGSFNIAIGHNALGQTANDVGSENVAIGYNALTVISTTSNGSKNVGIGSGSQVPVFSNSNQLSIQNVIYGINMGVANTSVGIAAVPVSFNGTNFAKLYVGGTSTTTEPSLQLNSVPATTAFPITNPNSLSNNFLYVDANGIVKQSPLPSANISATCSTTNFIPVWGAAGALDCSIIQQSTTLSNCAAGMHSGIGIGGAPIATTTSGSTCYELALTVYGSAFASGGLWIASDKKFKTGIQKIESAIDKITKLRGVSYSFDSKKFPEFKFPTGKTLGFIAQELKEVIPEAVSYTEKGFYAVNYDVVVPVLTEGIKEQQTQIESLQQQIEELKAMVNKLASGNIQKTVVTDNFEVQPNPITQTSNILYKLSDAGTKTTFVVYDLQGKMLKQINLPANTKEGQVQISKDDLPKGAYILSLVKGNAEVQSKRFLIME